MKRRKNKAAAATGLTAVILVIILLFFAVYYYNRALSVREEGRDLLYQLREGTVFRWSEEGITEDKEEGWSTYVIICRDQMEPLKKMSIHFTCEEEHLIMSCKEDGSFQSMWRLGSGKHTITVPENAYALYIAVQNDDMSGLKLKNTWKVEAESTYKGKYLSVLGDSISSYEGYIPQGFYPEYRAGSGMEVSSMWWYQTALKLGMNICGINGCSGSGVLPAGDGTGGNEERCVSLHTPEHTPDLILVLLGANDLFRGCSQEEFRAEYREMLERMQTRYPDAEIVLCSYFRPSKASFEVDEANELIKSIGEECGLRVVELKKSGIEERDPGEVYYDYDPEIGTGMHPNTEGQLLLSNYVCQELTERR